MDWATQPQVAASSRGSNLPRPSRWLISFLSSGMEASNSALTTAVSASGTWAFSDSAAFCGFWMENSSDLPSART